MTIYLYFYTYDDTNSESTYLTLTINIDTNNKIISILINNLTTNLYRFIYTYISFTLINVSLICKYLFYILLYIIHKFTLILNK